MASLVRWCLLTLVLVTIAHTSTGAAASDAHGPVVRHQERRMAASTGVPLQVGYVPNMTLSWLVAAAAQSALVASSQDVVLQAVGGYDGDVGNATRIVAAVGGGSPMVRLDLDSTAWGDVDATQGVASNAWEPLLRADGGRADVLGSSSISQSPGWYIPSYLLDTNPALATWQGLAAGTTAATVFGGNVLKLVLSFCACSEAAPAPRALQARHSVAPTQSPPRRHVVPIVPLLP